MLRRDPKLCHYFVIAPKVFQIPRQLFLLADISAGEKTSGNTLEIRTNATLLL